MGTSVAECILPAFVGAIAAGVTDEHLGIAESGQGPASDDGYAAGPAQGLVDLGERDQSGRRLVVRNSNHDRQEGNDVATVALPV